MLCLKPSDVISALENVMHPDELEFTVNEKVARTVPEIRHRFTTRSGYASYSF
jgi:hypothetical protein